MFNTNLLGIVKNGFNKTRIVIIYLQLSNNLERRTYLINQKFYIKRRGKYLYAK